MDSEDIIVWPSGTWCYRYELHEMQFAGDDYYVIDFGTDEYYYFIGINDDSE